MQSHTSEVKLNYYLQHKNAYVRNNVKLSPTRLTGRYTVNLKLKRASVQKDTILKYACDCTCVRNDRKPIYICVTAHTSLMTINHDVWEVHSDY